MDEEISETIIEIKHMDCKSGYRYLLKDITWTVKKGEHWVVFGMNGSGKTTLLSAIAGFRYFNSGTLKVFGQEFSNENILEFRKKLVGCLVLFLINIIRENRYWILYYLVGTEHWD